MATAPKNTAEDRYQMVVDLNETGGVKPPTFLDEDEQAGLQMARGRPEEHAVHVDDVDGDGGGVERDRKRFKGCAGRSSRRW